jgi:hypothetical protein
MPVYRDRPLRQSHRRRHRLHEQARVQDASQVNTPCTCFISTQVLILTPEGFRGREKAGGFASFEEAFTFEQAEDEHLVTIQLCDQVSTSNLRPHALVA